MKLAEFLKAAGLEVPVADFLKYTNEFSSTIYSWCEKEKYHHRVDKLIRLYKIDHGISDE